MSTTTIIIIAAVGLIWAGQLALVAPLCGRVFTAAIKARLDGCNVAAAVQALGD